MAIRFHPDPGSIVICDFHGLTHPEIQKRRPVVVMCPRFRSRFNICTVIPFSTTPPNPAESYHVRLVMDPPLPEPYSSQFQWVKADMIYAVSFDRLFLFGAGKAQSGQRQYHSRRVSDEDFKAIQACMLNGLGLASLVPHL